MESGISPVIGVVLLVAIAVMGAVAVWYWVSGYTAKPPSAETALKVYTITSVYKNPSNDGCYSLDIKNTGALPISGLVLEVRNYLNGTQVGSNNAWLADSGLVSYWPLDNNTNDSENLNNGTFYGESFYDFSNSSYSNAPIMFPTWTTGKYGNALSFNGNNMWINTTDQAALRGWKNFTLMAWINVTNHQAYEGIFGKWASASQTKNHYLLGYWAAGGYAWGTYSFFVGNNTNINSESDSLSFAAPPTGQWMHIAATFAGNTGDMLGNLTVYYNGVQNASKATNVTATGTGSQTLQIGAYVSYNFSGLMDSVRIYNTTLSPAQIQAEMNSSRPIIRSVIDLEFEQGTGTVANDTHTNVAGKFNGAYSFDGIDDYINLGNNYDITVDQPQTYSLWFKANNRGADEQLLSKGNYSSPWTGWYISIQASGGIRYQYFNTWATNAQSINTTSASFKDGIWHHLVVVRYNRSAANGLKIYTDGVLQTVNIVADTLTTSMSTNVNAEIGGRDGANDSFNGSIDDVAIFNRTLSTTEINSIYSNGQYAMSDAPGLTTIAYVNISADLAPGDTYNYNISTIVNSSNRLSLPLGTYLLRPSTYSSSMRGVSDTRFTCT